MSLNNHQRILASTISDHPKQIFENLRIFEKYAIKGIHFDAMDGIFVPRLGLYPELLAAICRSTNMYVEVHAMLQSPSSFIKDFADAGAHRIIVHLETSENMDALIDLIRSHGMEVGIAISPSTEISSIRKFIEKIDSIMLMAIVPGIPRHPFLPETFNRLTQLLAEIKNVNSITEVQIDGGVTFDNFQTLIDMGVDTLVCGSGTIFAKSRSLEHNLRKLLDRESSSETN